MVTRYGMSDKLGPIVYGKNQEEVFLGMTMSSQRDYSESVASEIDTEIRAIIDKAYSSTEQILKDHMDKLTFIAEYLIGHELMDEEQFRYIMENDEPTVEAVEAILETKNKKSEDENQQQKELNEQKEREEAEKKAEEEKTSDVQKFSVKKKVETVEESSDDAEKKDE